MARQSNCELVRKGEIKHIPKYWNDKGHPNCVGYIDSYRDTELPECKKCEWFWRNEGDSDGRE